MNIITAKKGRIVFILSYDVDKTGQWFCTCFKINDVIISACRKWLTTGASIPLNTIAGLMVNDLSIPVVDVNYTVAVILQIFNSPCIINSIAIRCEHIWNYKVPEQFYFDVGRSAAPEFIFGNQLVREGRIQGARPQKHGEQPVSGLLQRSLRLSSQP